MVRIKLHAIATRRAMNFTRYLPYKQNLGKHVYATMTSSEHVRLGFRFCIVIRAYFQIMREGSTVHGMGLRSSVKLARPTFNVRTNSSLRVKHGDREGKGPTPCGIQDSGTS